MTMGKPMLNLKMLMMMIQVFGELMMLLVFELIMILVCGLLYVVGNSFLGYFVKNS